MEKLALVLPGGQTVYGPITAFPSEANLATVVSQFLTLGIYLAGVLMLFWGFWGVFQYIFAGGNKERLTAARKRIVFAIFGFIMVALAFLIQKFVMGIYPVNPNLNVTPVTPPS